MNSDPNLTETIARAIWQSQKDRLKNNGGINSRVTWRSTEIPIAYWNSFFLDSQAVIKVLNLGSLLDLTNQKN